MTIRFAASRSPYNSPVARVLARRAIYSVANDNQYGDLTHEILLREALHFLALHGVKAAHHARKEAETAFFAGDRARYQRWLGVCRILDNRLAQSLERNRPHVPGWSEQVS